MCSNNNDKRIRELNNKVNRLKKELERSKVLSNKYGFYNLYRIETNRGFTPKQAFALINDEFYRIFKQYRFKSIKQFIIYHSRLMN